MGSRVAKRAGRAWPLIGAAACAALFAGAAPAGAATGTFGSDLTLPADTAHSDQADSVFWNTRQANGSSPTMPVGGQILEVRVKGRTLVAPNDTKPDHVAPGQAAPGNRIFFQTLKPQPDGTMKVDVTSQPFAMPYDVPPNTVTRFSPENLCAAQGDTIALNTVGGWDTTDPGSGGYPNGVPFEVFGQAAPAAFKRFHKHNGTGNGATLTNGTTAFPTEVNGQELLMQLTVGTGPDAYHRCPGGSFIPASERQGTTQASGPRATVPGDQLGVASSGEARLSLRCQSAGPCSGFATLSFLGRRNGITNVAIQVRSADFSLEPSTNGTAVFRLTSAQRTALREALARQPSTPATVVVSTRQPNGGTTTETALLRLKRAGVVLQDDVLPPPVLGETVNVRRSLGTVLLRVPGAKRFVKLVKPRQVPIGTEFDTYRGRVTLISAADRAGAIQDSWFYQGQFKVSQTKGPKPITSLRLSGLQPRCRARGSAVTSAKRRKRRLWGDGAGRFRTDGASSSATVRGTKWLVEDRCEGTFTRVVRGRVAVRDKVRRRTVILTAGESYLARRRR